MGRLSTVKELTLKLKKLYLKILKAQVKHKWDKARRLNARMIQLQLELKNNG